MPVHHVFVNRKLRYCLKIPTCRANLSLDNFLGSGCSTLMTKPLTSPARIPKPIRRTRVFSKIRRRKALITFVASLKFRIRLKNFLWALRSILNIARLASGLQTRFPARPLTKGRCRLYFVTTRATLDIHTAADIYWLANHAPAP